MSHHQCSCCHFSTVDFELYYENCPACGSTEMVNLNLLRLEAEEA